MKSFLRLLFLLLCLLLISRAQTCQTDKLDPRVANALGSVLADLPDFSTVSVEQSTEIMLDTPDFPTEDVQYIKITEDSIPVQIYNPAHTSGLPIIISYHPGGFVTPILSFMEYDFWRQAKTYKAIVFAVDYRVAPENKFPAAVNDSFNAFKWIAANGHHYGGDTSRIILLGYSAGGNLAAVVSQKAKLEGIAYKIKLQVLNCPSTDNPKNALNYSSYQKYAKGYFLTKEFCQYYIQAYAPHADLKNPEVAPIHGKDVSGLPPALIVTAEFDPLRDEGAAYATRLKNAGVKVWYACFPGQIHCLLGLPPEADEIKQFDVLVLNAMNQVLTKNK